MIRSAHQSISLEGLKDTRSRVSRSGRFIRCPIGSALVNPVYHQRSIHAGQQLPVFGGSSELF